VSRRYPGRSHVRLSEVSDGRHRIAAAAASTHPRHERRGGNDTATSGGAEATRDVQGQAGNAATEARASGAGPGAPGAGAAPGGADTANPDRAAEARPDWLAANNALVAAPFVFNTFLTAAAGLYRTGPAHVAAFISHATIIANLHATLSGAQMYQTLETLQHPARGAGRVVAWANHLRQCTSAAPATAYSGLLGGGDPGDVIALLDPSHDATLQAVLGALTTIDPLTLFATQQNGLYVGACSSATAPSTSPRSGATSS